MAFITEQATDMICKRLVDYGYEYHGQMHHKLYPVYLKVTGVIQIRLGLQKGFLNSVEKDEEMLCQIQKSLDIILPPKAKQTETGVTCNEEGGNLDTENFLRN